MFVNEVLRDHLFLLGYDSVSARIVGNPRLRNRGGIRPWPGVQREIVSHLRGDTRNVATTMVDFYGLPQQGQGAWPGRSGARGVDAAAKASAVEGALLEAIAREMGQGFNQSRFIPFVVMHEFEGLLFSDCAAFAKAVGQPAVETRLKAIRDQFPTPEDINDSPGNAPSKRVASVISGYEKPLFGNLAAMEIGFNSIRAQCLHFNGWMLRLRAAAEQ
jgi:hypothetical protein